MSETLTPDSKIACERSLILARDLREDTRKVVPGRSQIFAKTRPHGFSKYWLPLVDRHKGSLIQEER